jgi:hypothetical protein
MIFIFPFRGFPQTLIVIGVFAKIGDLTGCPLSVGQGGIDDGWHLIRFATRALVFGLYLSIC